MDWFYDVIDPRQEVLGTLLFAVWQPDTDGRELQVQHRHNCYGKSQNTACTMGEKLFGIIAVSSVAYYAENE